MVWARDALGCLASEPLGRNKLQLILPLSSTSRHSFARATTSHALSHAHTQLLLPAQSSSPPCLLVLVAPAPPLPFAAPRSPKTSWLRLHVLCSTSPPSSPWPLPLPVQPQETTPIQHVQMQAQTGEFCHSRRCVPFAHGPCPPPQSFFTFHHTARYTIYPSASSSTHPSAMVSPPSPTRTLVNFSRPRRANGATQTFRRPSHAPTLSGSTTQSTVRDAPGPQNPSSANPGVYVPPHAQSGRNGSSAEGRYSRDQLLQLYHAQRESESIKDGLSSLYVGAWEPSISNGTSSATWGRRDDPAKEAPSGVDLCWDKDGNVLPLSLTDMTDEEKEVCDFLLLQNCAPSNPFLT